MVLQNNQKYIGDMISAIMHNKMNVLGEVLGLASCHKQSRNAGTHG